MRLEEFDDFKGELKQLCSTLGKAYTDALGQAYWRALKDVELDEIQAHVERIILNATPETKFPKPRQLREKPGRVEVADPEFIEMQRKAAERLEELRRTNLEEWFRVMGDRPAVRLVKQLGTANVFFDAQEMCWRRTAR